jgi:hypothetical protein
MATRDERILKKLETEIRLSESNDAVITQAFEQMITFLRSSQDSQAKIIEEIASAMNQSFTELEKTSIKKFDGTSKDLRFYLQSEMEVIKSQHYDALANLSMRLSTLRNGKDANEQFIIDSVLAKIPPVKVPEIIPETPDQVVQKINQSNQIIKKERVEGLADALMNIAFAAMSSMPVTTSFFNGLRAKNLTINGATASQRGDTVFLDVPTSGGGGSGGLTGAQEKSTTTPDGVATTFTFTHTPTLIYWNGAFQTLTDDYTVSGNTITFTASAGIPQTGDKIVNSYGGLTGTQEKSTTTPDGIQTTFTFAHVPTLVYWNGAFQTLTDDYTISGVTITFTATAGIPQTGDKIVNVYA